MKREATPRVAQGIQTSGVGTDPEGGVARAGAGDPGAMLHGSSLIACGVFFSPCILHPTPLAHAPNLPPGRESQGGHGATPE